MKRARRPNQGDVARLKAELKEFKVKLKKAEDERDARAGASLVLGSYLWDLIERAVDDRITVRLGEHLDDDHTPLDRDLRRAIDVRIDEHHHEGK